MEDRTLLNAYVVTTTADSGAGSLRDAITKINADTSHAYASPSNPNVDEIDFNITAVSDVAGGGTGYNATTGVATITPQSALPDITNAVIINGYTEGHIQGVPTPLAAMANTLAGVGQLGSAPQGLSGDNAMLKVVLNGSSVTTWANNNHAPGNGLTITAGNSTVTGLVLYGFGANAGSSAIALNTNGGDVIAGNFIGTDVNGTTALGNGVGIDVTAGSNNDVIGGTTAAARNVISAGGNYGVYITPSEFGSPGVTGAAPAGTMVQGNFIGTDATGTQGTDANGQALGNFYNGVYLDGATNTLIGGTTAGSGNLISANGSGDPTLGFTGGVSIGQNNDPGLTTGTLVEGNFIGTDVTGTKALGNSRGVHARATATVIGGTAAGTGNLISANASYGIDGGDQIQGNYIGIDVTGKVALGNAVGASGGVIGGTVAQARNVISGNGTGIDAASLIEGNFIGTDATGTKAVPNVAGISFSRTSGGVIGGPTAGARNIISGNITGIDLDRSTGVQVQGNYIGTDVNGAAALANSRGIVIVNGSGNDLIGGTSAGEGNLISGNTSGGNGRGIDVDGSSTTITIQGNRIGTDAAGTTALGNDTGISLAGSNSTVGGTSAGAGNLISGSVNGFGIIVGGSSNVVQGNLIGTDLNGNNAGLGDFQGVGAGGTNNTIGGTAPRAGNVIAYNGNSSQGVGISLNTNSYQVTIAGNQIIGNMGDGGIDDFGSTGTTILANSIDSNLTGIRLDVGPTSGERVQGNMIEHNAGNGILVESGAGPNNNNVIGGNGAGNVIAFNGHDGVFVDFANDNGQTISQNSIYSNGNLGIERHNSVGAVPAPPTLTGGTASTSGTTVTGTIAGTAGTTFRIEFFSNSSSLAPDTGNTGEGQTYLASATVGYDASGHLYSPDGSAVITTDAHGNPVFQVSLPATPVGGYISATATNLATADTSQFSGDLANPATTVSASPNPSFFGQPVTFTATVSTVQPAFGTPTGTVDFVNTTTNTDLGTAPLSGGRASLTVSSLTPGSHVITATYSGDGTFFKNSATTTQTVTRSIFVLNPTASGALSLSGNASINIPGMVVVDSSSTTALTESGNASITAASIQVVGGVKETSNATTSPKPSTGVAPVADPLAGLAAPTGGVARGAVDLTSGSLTINPGVYSQIKVSGSATLTLNPGIYVIAGGGFSVSVDASVTTGTVVSPDTGTGVVIYNTSNGAGTYGGISFSGKGSFNLAAPSTGPYAGVLIFQDRANTRALAFSGNAAPGMGGTIYAANALAYLSAGAQVQGSLVVGQLQLSGNTASTLTADGSAGGSASAGQLLGGDVLVYVNNSNGDLTSDELARVQDAVNAVDATTAPFGVDVAEVSDPSAANVVLDGNTTSAAGGYADGVLGSFSPGTGEITMIDGWNWYAGTGAPGSSQYDFQTAVTHELGHALGLGHSSNAGSVMYASLPTGLAKRVLTTADLNIPDPSTAVDALHAAPTRVATSQSGKPGHRETAGHGERADIRVSYSSLASALESTDSAGPLNISYGGQGSQANRDAAIRDTAGRFDAADGKSGRAGGNPVGLSALPAHTNVVRTGAPGLDWLPSLDGGQGGDGVAAFLDAWTGSGAWRPAGVMLGR